MKTAKKTIILLFIFAINLNVVAQNNNIDFQKFEGKITNTIEMIGLPKEMEMFASMMPKENINYIKNDMVVMDQTSSMSVIKVYINNKTNEMNTYTEMMGRKYVIKTKTDDREKENKNMYKNIQVQKTNETKKIAGYMCKKFIVKFTNDKDAASNLEIWSTNEINYKIDYVQEPWFKNIEGVPMQYEAIQGNFRIKFTTTKIEKTPLADAIFKEPTGYEEVTPESLMNSGFDK